MACRAQNIKVVKGNEFALLFPLKSRTYTLDGRYVDEDIDYSHLVDCKISIGGTEYTYTIEQGGLQVIVPPTLFLGTYDAIITAIYDGSNLRASYYELLTIVDYNYQSDAEQYIAGSPIAVDAYVIIAGALTDAELDALKAEYREKIAVAEQAQAAAEASKEAYDAKAEQLEDVAQQSTLTQGVADIREDISHINIDTSTLAKQGSNESATLTATQTAATNAMQYAEDAKTAAQAITGYATETNATANKNAIIAQIQANAGIPTLTIPSTTASQELAPNTLYIFAERTTDLTLTLGAPIVGVANEYHLFLTTGSAAPTITWPTGISWNGGSAPTIATSKTYEVSILNNIAAYFEV